MPRHDRSAHRRAADTTSIAPLAPPALPAISPIMASLAASICFVPSALGDFTGLSAISWGQCPGPCCCIVELYACFDEPTDVLLSVSNASISVPIPWVFLQGPAAPNWAPQMIAPTGCDSWVTIGAPPGTINTTALDPNFVAMPSSLDGVGWFNTTPVNQQGKVSAAGTVLIGRFAVPGVPNVAPVLIVDDLCVTWNNGPATPAAVACLAEPVVFPYSCQPVGVPTSHGCGVGCIGDTNADGVVDGGDLGGLLGAWGSNDPQYDLNHDGVVNGADAGLLLGGWGACG